MSRVCRVSWKAVKPTVRLAHGTPFLLDRVACYLPLDLYLFSFPSFPFHHTLQRLEAFLATQWCNVPRALLQFCAVREVPSHGRPATPQRSPRPQVRALLRKSCALMTIPERQNTVARGWRTCRQVKLPPSVGCGRRELSGSPHAEHRAHWLAAP